MDWGTVGQWAPVLLGVVANVWVGFQWVLSRKFATVESVLAINKVLQDQVDDLREANREAHHKIELLQKDLGNLPTYSQFNDLKEDIGVLKQGQATGREKMDGLKDSVSLLRDQVGRIDEFIRSRP